MKKTKWIVGLSLASLIALSGTAFALNSRTTVAQTTRQAQSEPAVASTQYQGTLPDTNSNDTVNSPSANQSINTTPSSFRGNTNNGTSGSNGFVGGYGMMGGYGANGNGGYGMMGYGMMSGGYNAQSLGVNLSNGVVESSDQAIAIAKAYTQKINQNVVADELHEFSNGYEVELKDAKTGANAYEIMIYKNGGQIISEMGPNIMWNTKYGHMNWGNAGAVTVSEEQATKIAQDFVTQMGQGYSIGTPELAPGYYEFMVQKDGKDYTELDVNGYTGQVWLENWQGPILNSIEIK